jgi:vitamin B12 transporter
VISVTTKRGEGPPKVTASVEAGSYGTFNQAMGFSGGDDRFNYALNIAHFKSEATPVTPDNLVPPGRRINPNSYDNWSYSARLGFALTDTVSLNWVGRYTDGYLLSTGDSGFPEPAPTPTAPPGLQAGLHPRRGRLGPARRALRQPLRHRLHQSGPLQPRRECATGILGLPTPNLGERTKFDWRGDLKLIEGHTLVMGLQYENERLESRTLTASSATPAPSRIAVQLHRPLLPGRQHPL